MPRDCEALVRALPCWRGAAKLEPLHGGLSNVSFRVTDDAGVYVARVGEDFPFHHVSRVAEAKASQWAYEAGLSPKVIYAEAGVLVCDFIAGRTFEAADIRWHLADVAAMVKRGHHEMRSRARGPARFFWPFHVIRDYADALRAERHDVAPALARLLQLNNELEAAQPPSRIVFGHHDLLPGNIIGDGKRLWLIDWEYAAFGAPLFDLANLAGNASFSAQEERRLLHIYFEAEPKRDLLAGFAAMKAASHLREALWACISQTRLAAPGADYAAYAKTCLDKFEAAYGAYRKEFLRP